MELLIKVLNESCWSNVRTNYLKNPRRKCWWNPRKMSGETLPEGTPGRISEDIFKKFQKIILEELSKQLWKKKKHRENLERFWRHHFGETLTKKQILMIFQEKFLAKLQNKFLNEFRHLACKISKTITIQTSQKMLEGITRLIGTPVGIPGIRNYFFVNFSSLQIK